MDWATVKEQMVSTLWSDLKAQGLVTGDITPEYRESLGQAVGRLVKVSGPYGWQERGLVGIYTLFERMDEPMSADDKNRIISLTENFATMINEKTEP